MTIQIPDKIASAVSFCLVGPHTLHHHLGDKHSPRASHALPLVQIERESPTASLALNEPASGSLAAPIDFCRITQPVTVPGRVLDASVQLLL